MTLGRRRLSLLLSSVIVVAGLVACGTQTESHWVDEPDPAASGDAGFDSAPSPDSGLGILTFRPARSYSGFDGTHTFTVPVAVYDSASDLTVTADDPSAVDIAPKTLTNPVKSDGTTDNGKYFFVTVKKAGTITLTASSQGRSAQSTLTVTSYTPDRWSTGEARYKTGEAGDPPCTDCHVNGQAIDHSPAALATSDDTKVGVVITTGISTAGFPIMIDGKPGHRWHVTDAEKAGLITYLRALAPRGFK